MSMGTLAPAGSSATKLSASGLAERIESPKCKRFVLLAHDPGIRIAGVGLFVDRKLVAAALVRNPQKQGNGVAACVAMAREIATWARLKLRQVPSYDFVEHEASRIDELITEWPQIYTDDKQVGDANDLPPLAGIGCALGALLPDAILNHTLPKPWKGQVPGDAFTARILGRLEADEVEVLAKAILRVDPVLHTDRIDALRKHSTAHNAIDAAGLGLYHLGRLDRRRVISR